jgi:ABC-type transporter lipoprotein component MlaA/pimeloyl-ACP methyl ester carboxylesterase
MSSKSKFWFQARFPKCLCNVAIALSCVFSIQVAEAQTAPADSGVQKGSGTRDDVIVLPKPVPDPLEAVNRTVWGFNRGVMTAVIKPTARVYRFVVIKPIRTGLSNFGRNAAYPGRLVNNLLEGKWAGARDESDRFFINTILGGAGFFDIASKWDIPKSDADFGLTFDKWGWRPQCFLMLPILGPSNERDSVGLAADSAANPFTYLTPYALRWDNPATYLSPYTYYAAGVTYNNLSDSVDKYVRFAQGEKDPYSEVQYAWGFSRSTKQPDWDLKSPPDEASLQTLQSAGCSCHDPKFPNRGKTRLVRIPSTGRNLKFTVWMQPKKAPVVFINPGLGSHRLTDLVLALAESAYQQGFSVVSISSTHNYEFMENASTAALPSYSPVDAHDVHVALTEISRRLEAMFPGRWGSKALLGYSMGAFQTLFIAGTAGTNQESLLQFDRYLAIDTPVRLLHGVAQLDKFYQAPLTWPASNRTTRLENTFLKVAALTQASRPTNAPPPFEGVESKFLIGLNFRLILRDIIYSSQQRTNQRVLVQPVSSMRRQELYDEILQYSYRSYFEKFLIPYYLTRGVDLRTLEALQKASNLRTYAESLEANQKVRVIVNRNDILLDPEDLQWLETTFGSQRLTVFDKGGHLGNLCLPDVQKTILGALDGLGGK